MKSPDPRRGLALCGIVAILLAGCAHQNTPDPAADAATSATPVTDEPEPPASPPASTSEPTGTAPIGSESRPDVELEPATVAVAGGELPPPIIDGYATNGGDLITPQEWRNRFGESPLPQLTGPGVTLVEALQRTERGSDGWVRVDETSWLTMATAERDSTIAELADAAGVDGAPSRTSSTKEAADCVIDTYPVSPAGVTWQVQGCSYKRFPRMLTLGVSRTGPTDTAPSALDPTVAAVVADLDGELTFTEVRFGSPGEDGSTLHLSAQVTTGIDLDAAGTAMTAGPLAGWQTFPGDTSLLLSGPTGATWTLSERVAVFTWAGRW